jgi:cystathionine beta-lyase/cystathionine gamma-synthase
MIDKDKKSMHFETMAIHAGAGPEDGSSALVRPVQLSASFKLPDFGPELFDALLLESDRPQYAYSRWSNPTLRALEDKMSALEGGEAALVTATGMAAVSAVVLGLLNKGDHLVAQELCYVGSQELFGEHLSNYGIEVTMVDTSDLLQVEAALKPNTKMIYCETPSNPVLRISDIKALAGLAHASKIKLVVDSTYATPYLQKPLYLGADMVIHSLTKFINGHGDALGGVVIGSQAEIKELRKKMLVHLGGAASPFNAWLIARGAATLPLRMEKHCSNAMAIARYLSSHPAVVKVCYPGLSDHPHYKVASRQMSAFGGMLTFQLREGLSAAIKMAEKIKVFSYATSLGHPHSLIFYYPTDLYIDQALYLSEAQKKAIREQWMGEGIVRISAGLENETDLLEDLDSALAARIK